MDVQNSSEQIMILKPAFSHNIWGGDRLAKEYGYDIQGNDIGECWGISAYPGYESVIANGVHEGVSLSDFWNSHREYFGNIEMDKFPLLVKIIDAKDDLSIQVHPDDEYASKNEKGSLGKTECWYILDCPEDAKLVIGHNAKTKEELVSFIEHKQWGDLIREVTVKKGDFIQIDPGTVHAIKGGFQILETQQSSDITYRLYDYDRLSNGKPRDLHLNQSMDVIQVPAKEIGDTIIDTSHKVSNELIELIQSKYYTVYKTTVTENITFERKGPFMLGTVTVGKGSINGLSIEKGCHFIVPNMTHKITLEGNMECIFSAI